MLRRTVAVAVVLAGSLVVACSGQPLPIPTPPPASVDPSATPSSGDPSASAEPPSAVERFRALVSDPGFSARISLSGDVLATVSDLTVSGSLALSGDNASTSTKYKFDDGHTDTVQTRLVGGKLWTKLNGASWKTAKLVATTAVDPFSGAQSPAGVVDGGAKTVKGKSLRMLTVQGGRLLDLTTIPAYNLTEERVTTSILTVYVDGAGRPVSGHWVQRGQGRVSGQLQEVDVDVDLTFSGVGSSISITAP
jgi:hypothetical protein